MRQKFSIILVVGYFGDRVQVSITLAENELTLDNSLFLTKLSRATYWIGLGYNKSNLVELEYIFPRLALGRFLVSFPGNPEFS